MRFALCNEIFEGWDFARVAEFVASAGYDGIELAPFMFERSVSDISAARRTEIRRIAADHGLAITGLHWLLAKTEGLQLCDPDASVRQRTIEYLVQLIDFCGDVGGTVMTFGSPQQRSIPDTVTRQEGWDFATAAFQACGIASRARGVTFCLEALPTSLTNLLTTNGEVVEMLNSVRDENVRLMLDVKSMCSESISIVENIRRNRGLFHHVHANDANLRGPGFGDVDFRPIFKALSEANYQGFVSVEVFDFKPDPETIARQSLAYMKSCL